jgi:hypothetical protein
MARTFFCTLIVTACCTTAWAAPVGTAFNYQGRLTDGGSPATGQYDLRFTLYDAGTGGNPVGSPVLVEDRQVTNGLFTVTLDFGNVFNGDARWLQIDVRPGISTGAFTDLVPRQELLPAPYARYAVSGAGGGQWSASGDNIYNTNSGNVGIGTSSPVHKLHVAGLTRFDVGTGNISMSTPGGWPGLIAYSLNGHRRDIIFDDTTLKLLVSPTAAAPAATSGININEAGDVGIGTLSPRSKLDVIGSARSEYLISDNWVQARSHTAVSPSGNKCGDFFGDNTYGGTLQLWSTGADAWGAELKGNGAGGGGQMLLYNAANNVSAQLDGENNGGGSRLVMSNGSATTIEMLARAYGYGSQVNFKSSNGNTRIQFTGETGGMKLFDSSVQEKFWIEGQTTGAVCHFRNANGAVSVAINGSTGRTTTKTLEITGGSDVSEPFDIVSADLAVRPGMVVSIDAKNPGGLIVSRKAYDRTVAGIVSGAGGVNPGLVMGQKDSSADGAHPVALTGRVYCWVDASGGAVEPGDLLTTSDTPGHAMKVLDYPRAQGAILGKAMSSLEAGRKGLVLVLVTLQ